jgi:hypothetical protein
MAKPEPPLHFEDWFDDEPDTGYVRKLFFASES